MRANGARRWLKPAALAAAVALLGFFGKMDLVTEGVSSIADRDLMIRWTSAFAGAAREGVPVTFIDVDAPTMALYGAPDRARRRLLASLLDLARAKRALGVFLDVDLSKASNEPGADEALKASLLDWPAQGPPLALAMRFRAKESDAERLEPAPILFADALAGRANVRPAASLALTDADGVVRRWRLSQTVCADKSGVAYPSPQLIAAAAAGGRGSGDLQAFLDWRARASCAKADAPRPAWPRNAAQEAHISFLFGPADADGGPRVTRADGREVALFRHVSARTLVDARGAALAPASVSDEPFAGRFVVIGASHADAHDAHLTPIGRLPGALVAANAIAGAPAILDAADIGPGGRTLIALALFGAMAFATLRLRAAVAGLVVALFCLAGLPALGRIVAPSSALEIVASAIAMLATFAALETLLEIAAALRAGQGWRVVLKPSRAPATETN